MYMLLIIKYIDCWIIRLTAVGSASLILLKQGIKQCQSHYTINYFSNTCLCHGNLRVLANMSMYFGSEKP